LIGKEKQLVNLTMLSPKKRLAFALLVFERMLPSLIAFSEDTGLDLSCYLLARNAAWSALRDGVVDQSLDRACLRNAPDTEEFSHELTSYALNAALAISEIVQFAADARNEHVSQVSTLAQDSVHLYLASMEQSVVTTPEKERWIGCHPLMHQEQRQEEEDAQFLSDLPDPIDDNAVSSVKARAHAQSPLLPLDRPARH
jgi:uncharacterized protein